MKLILAGGSGYIGSVLADHYKNKGWDVCILSRSNRIISNGSRMVVWDGATPGNWVKELEGADMLINLTGKNVNCRYHERNKAEILHSRLDATEVLHQAIALVKNPPAVWIQCVSATIYRHAEDRPMDEMTGEVGEGFSVDVCKQWEETFWRPSSPCRRVALRTGIVMGMRDGALPRLLTLTRAGLGGSQGTGKQWVSWIHEQDMATLVDWIYTNPNATGVYNAVAPHPIQNKPMMARIRKFCRMPFGVSTPAWLLEIGAAIIGTETELVLKSRWVIPRRLTEEGFVFRHPTFDSCFTRFLHP